MVNRESEMGVPDVDEGMDPKGVTTVTGVRTFS